MISKGLKDMINITRQVKVSSWLIETIHYKYRKKVPLNVGNEKKSRNQQPLNNDRKIFSRPKSRTEKTFFKGSCKFDFMKKLSVISNISCKKTIQLVISLVARRSYSRSIPPTFDKLFAINKDLEKLWGVSTVVSDKDENLL